MIHAHTVEDVGLWTIGISSLLYRMMPAPEKFAKWPRFQSTYGIIYVFISYPALNK